MELLTQLPMFLPARELTEFALGDSDETFRSKYAEVCDTFIDAVVAHGVIVPIVCSIGVQDYATQGGPCIRDGHHRVAVAAKHMPAAEVPLLWSDDLGEWNRSWEVSMSVSWDDYEADLDDFVQDKSTWGFLLRPRPTTRGEAV